MTVCSEAVKDSPAAATVSLSLKVRIVANSNRNTVLGL